MEAGFFCYYISKTFAGWLKLIINKSIDTAMGIPSEVNLPW